MVFLRSDPLDEARAERILAFQLPARRSGVIGFLESSVIGRLILTLFCCQPEYRRLEKHRTYLYNLYIPPEHRLYPIYCQAVSRYEMHYPYERIVIRETPVFSKSNIPVVSSSGQRVPPKTSKRVQSLHGERSTVDRSTNLFNQVYTIPSDIDYSKGLSFRAFSPTSDPRTASSMPSSDRSTNVSNRVFTAPCNPQGTLATSSFDRSTNVTQELSRARQQPSFAAMTPSNRSTNVSNRTFPTPSNPQSISAMPSSDRSTNVGSRTTQGGGPALMRQTKRR